MQAGKLRDWIVIQSKTATRASNGEQVPTYATFAETWAEVAPLSGRELLTIRDEMSQVTTRIRLRYLTGIKPEMRVTHNGSTYEITEIIDRANRGAELELLCTSEAVTT